MTRVILILLCLCWPALASGQALGEQRTLVALVNFQDTRTQPWSVDQAQQAIFGPNSMASFWTEASAGQTWFTGTVTPWLTLPVNLSAGCGQGSTWPPLVDAAITTAGFTLAAYQRIMIVTNAAGSCSTLNGTAQVNGTKAWLFGNLNVSTARHEMGHLLGLWESQGETCQPTCTTFTYAPNDDITGQPSAGLPNAVNRELLGFGEALRVTESGDYFLRGYALPENGQPKAIKMFAMQSGILGLPTYLYVEARVQAGYDLSVPPGVKLHAGTFCCAPILKDLDPSSGRDYVLDPGQVYTWNGVRVRTMTADITGALVHVDFLNPQASVRNLRVRP